MTSLHDLTATTPGLPCRRAPELWFSPNHIERQAAARQCHQCPLLLECMRTALATDEQFGVWGGVDFEARALGCGTGRGYHAHVRRREPVCARCQAAREEALEANRRRLLVVAHAAGGSVRGYWMHRRLGEEACVGCKGAQARQSADRRARTRARAVGPHVVPVTSGTSDRLSGAPAGAQSLAAA